MNEGENAVEAILISRHEVKGTLTKAILDDLFPLALMVKRRRWMIFDECIPFSSLAVLHQNYLHIVLRLGVRGGESVVWYE